MGFNVAIDGPAGAGKSTVAKMCAAEMKFIYVDTGAMYRAIGLWLLENGIDLNSEDDVEKQLDHIDVTIGYENGAQQVYLNGRNVSASIRTQEVGGAASVTSRYRAVRAKLLDLQRDLARKNDVLMDGRDIGTQVLPEADLKIYLSADARVRAKRRYDELAAKGQTCDFDVILKEIEERDYRDMHREIAPLKRAADAVDVDSSELTIEETAEKIIGLIRERMQ